MANLNQWLQYLPPPHGLRQSRPGERLRRAIEIRDRALVEMEIHGQWKKMSGLDAKWVENENFMFVFYVRPHDPYGIATGTFGLELWPRGRGKVLNLSWRSTAAKPHIVSFRRGDWESVFLARSVG